MFFPFLLQRGLLFGYIYIAITYSLSPGTWWGVGLLGSAGMQARWEETYLISARGEVVCV